MLYPKYQSTEPKDKKVRGIVHYKTTVFITDLLKFKLNLAYKFTGIITFKLYFDGKEIGSPN